MHAVHVLGMACGAGYLRVRVRAVHGLRSGLRVRARERARAVHGIPVGGFWRWGAAGHGIGASFCGCGLVLGMACGAGRDIQGV